MNSVARGLWILGITAVVAGCGGSGSDPDPKPNPNPVTFDSGQVRPLALSSTGDRLLATNTPAGMLEVLAVDDAGITAVASVPVGLEPVAVSMRNDNEAWVVNHLSDSVSIVDLSVEPARVVNTLLVGDEPRDIVFAGPENRYAYITTAHRGQNGPTDQPVDAELFTAGAGRTDVWVFDTTNLGSSLGGEPTDVATFFGDTARALAVNADKSVVYVAVMNSGNRTTTIGENRLAKHGVTMSADGKTQPDTGLIVQFDGTDWVDETGASSEQRGRMYNDLVPFTLPDYDVFAISATATPTLLERHAGVGTTLFNMAVNPVTDELYVSNTEALNVNRFEGPGIASPSVNGNFVRNRITVINQTDVAPQGLNTHIDRTLASGTDEMRSLSIAQPMGMAVKSDGSEVIVAGFGSGKLFVYDTDAFGSDAFQVSKTIDLSGDGPTDVILDETRNRAYALTRFNNAVSIINTETMTETNSVKLFNPEPARVISGRPFLYNAEELSRFGEVSCGTCHVFGDTDSMAWDLGNPDGEVVVNPNAFVNSSLRPNGQAQFHPMKGPMTTQSLRGLQNAGPMHWRGDRTGADRAANESIESGAFKEFNEAFVALLGRDEILTEDEMALFTEFALELSYPPNPIRALDNSLTDAETAGRDTYFNKITTGSAFTCNDCHTIDLTMGHFGTSGDSSVEGSDISQEFKVPHIRNMYQKVGKFGNTGRFSADDGNAGEQIRGFGFMHDGHMDTLNNFFKGDVFRFDFNAAENERIISEVVAFVMAADSELAPIVGQQVTLSAGFGADKQQRLDLLVERAGVTTPRAECDLVARGVVDGVARGYFMDAPNEFKSDRAAERSTLNELLDSVRNDEAVLTFTCVPPASGVWFGIDKNEDGVLDGDS